ncbi:MAG TPA: hypothetical protein VGF28_19420 [Thermoanaerobaculia bacterium]|jgi:ELWxxDGT repeat protein
MRSTALFITVVLAFPAFAADALVPYLVKDLTPGESTTRTIPSWWSEALGELVFFGTSDVKRGLWRTDGTTAGTHRVYDGTSDAYVDPLIRPAKADGFLYYASSTADGTTLYRTDGTTPGTNVVAKIPSWHGGAPCGDRKLCFATGGSRIAVTDGTAAGTTELLSTGSGVETDLPRYMTAVGKRVYFNAYDEQHGLCTRVPAALAGIICGELWTSDGTIAGTHLFKDLVPGEAPGAPANLFASSDHKLYFAAADPSFPGVAQAWVSDGSPDGTQMLSTKPSSWRQPPSFAEIDGRVFFTNSDGDLFETDGTPAGTHSLRERFASTEMILVPFGAANGRILLWAYHSNGGSTELWSRHGTALTKLSDIPFAFRPLGFLQTTGHAWFVTDQGEMWSTDGTAEGTGRRFSGPASGGTMFSAARTPTRLYYGDGGSNRYVTDGTEPGTRRIDLAVPTAAGTWIRETAVVNGRFYFAASDKFGTSDGTAEGTVVLLKGRMDEPFAHEGQTYFYENATLWKTDGTVEGTIRVRDWLGADSPRPPAFIGNQAIFADGSTPTRLLRRDPDGTLHDLGFTDHHFDALTSVHGGVAFWAGSVPRLMYTDGTAGGTRTVAANFSRSGALLSVGAQAIFAGRKVGDTTLRLWVTDFTAEGTRAVKDFPEPVSHYDLTPLLQWRGLAIFRVGVHDVWRSDGTGEGTFRLAEGSFDAVLADGDELVFIRFTSPGYEVWTSDGTTAGTQRRDVYTEGIPAGEPFVMAGGGVGVLYSPAPKHVHLRNHRTKAVEVIDWRVVSGIPWGVGNGNLIYFPAERGSSGHELWAVRLDELRPWPPTSLRVAYVGTAKTTNGLGAVFHVHVKDRGTDPPRVTATTVDGTLSAEHDYVPFTRDVVFEDDHEVTLVVPLRHANARGTLSIVLAAPVNGTITEGIATAQVGGSARRRTVRK